MKTILFEEEQRFNQWWIYALIIFTAIVLSGTMLSVLINTDVGFLGGAFTGVSVVFSLFLIYTVIVMKLETIITEESIKINYYPFLKREWKWSELKTAQVLDYGFVGGWGIRLWTGMGTVYNVRGSKGLHLKTDNKEYVIGTQKEEELRSSIAHLLK